MTKLWTPTVAYTEAGSSDHAQCGPLCEQAAAWVLGDYQPVPYHDNANAETLVEWLEELGGGFHAAIDTRPPTQVIADNIPLGRYVITGIMCNGNADPVPYWTSITHWLLFFDTDLTCLNVWHGTYPQVRNIDACWYSAMKNVVVWRDGVDPIDHPAPLPIVGGKEDEMIIGPFTEQHDGLQHVYALGGDGNVYEAWGSSGAEALANLNLDANHNVQSDVGAFGSNIASLSGGKLENGDIILKVVYSDGSIAFDSKDDADGHWYGITRIGGFHAKV